MCFFFTSLSNPDGKCVLTKMKTRRTLKRKKKQNKKQENRSSLQETSLPQKVKKIGDRWQKSGPDKDECQTWRQ